MPEAVAKVKEKADGLTESFGAREQAAGLGQKTVDEGLARLPQVVGDVADLAQDAHGRQRTVQEQRQQAALGMQIWHTAQPDSHQHLWTPSRLSMLSERLGNMDAIHHRARRP